MNKQITIEVINSYENLKNVKDAGLEGWFNKFKGTMIVGELCEDTWDVTSVEAFRGDKIYKTFDGYIIPISLLNIDEEVEDPNSIKITKYEHRIEDVIEATDLPEDLRDEIYDQAINGEKQYLADYCDGDFKFIVLFQFEGQNFYDNGWVSRLVKLLPKKIVKRNKLAIAFYQ